MKYSLFILFCLILFSCSTDPNITSNSSSGTLSGSYATMLPIDDFLYVVNDTEIITYDITDNRNPILVDQQAVGFDIESLFHLSKTLFIGSPTHFHIFEIQENGIPIEQSTTQHELLLPEINLFDPIVADEHFAYITLRTNNENANIWNPWRNLNELRIYNIDDKENPELVSTTFMDSPAGLGIKGNYLFVCEANLGIKLFDVSDRLNPIEVWEDTGFESYDLIIKDDLLMVVGPESIRQYDISDIYKITYLTELVF